jgi:hypothetical protein
MRLKTAHFTSVVLPHHILAEITEKDEWCIPIVKWLYSFSGRTSDSDDPFLLTTADELAELKFIVDTKNSTRQLTRMSNLDPENIRLYHNAYPRMDVETLPDVPGSFVYNPLKYRPAGNLVLAVRKGYIYLALSNCTSPAARAMGDFTSRRFEYFVNLSAAHHVQEVGRATFEATVGIPADRGLKRKLIESNLSLSRQCVETRKEKYGRLRAEARIEKVAMRLEHKELECEEKEAAHQLAICDKEESDAKHSHYVAVNQPIHTQINQIGDNLVRVGCVQVKVTNPDSYEMAEYVRRHGACTVKMVSDDPSEDDSHKTRFLAAHHSEISASSTAPSTIADCLRACTNRQTKYTEAKTPSLTLMGGHNVSQIRTVFRENARDLYGGSSGCRRANTLFYTLPGEYPGVIASLVSTCEQSFAAGVADGKLAFVNRVILDSLSEEDRSTVALAVEDLAGVSVYFHKTKTE